MNLKWRYGLLLVAPSLLLIVVAWMLNVWSPEETVTNLQARDTPAETEEPELHNEPRRDEAPIETDLPSHETMEESQEAEKDETDEDSELTGRVIGFLEELHSRDPHEPSTARELRIKEYATDRFWRDIAPFISNEAEDRVMIEDGLFIEATATVLRTEQLSSYRVFVVAEVDITVHEEGGIYSSYQPRHTTTWIKHDGEWYVNEARYG